MLDTVHVDLEAFGSLKVRELPIQVDYFKHIKRCCLIDLWSVTEIRIREIAEEKALWIEGRMGKAKDLIVDARKIIRSERARMLLKRAERKLGGEFIEFPSYLSAVLKRSEFGTEEVKDWRKFFDIFRIMRNSVHNNFTCTETRFLQYRGFSKDFVKGKPIEVLFDDLRKIIDRLLEFFESTENMD